MSIERFKITNFNSTSVRMIQHSNRILNEYASIGLRMTLRQLYYQLVISNIISNGQRAYKRLGHLISEARLGGKVDWDHIEDRVRSPQKSDEFEGPKELMDRAIANYRLHRWEGQKNYIELWVEKDALANVLWPLAEEFHVTLMVNRGYSSQSAMYESVHRFRSNTFEGQSPHLLYLGDFDPSGEDMVRDITDRFEMYGYPMVVEKIALNLAQVRKYKLPPNPAKMSDPRAGKYVAAHGDESWEVDALRPDILQQMIRERLEKLVDRAVLAKILCQESRDRVRLRKAEKLLRSGEWMYQPRKNA